MKKITVPYSGLAEQLQLTQGVLEVPSKCGTSLPHQHPKIPAIFRQWSHANVTLDSDFEFWCSDLSGFLCHTFSIFKCWLEQHVSSCPKLWDIVLQPHPTWWCWSSRCYWCSLTNPFSFCFTAEHYHLHKIQENTQTFLVLMKKKKSLNWNTFAKVRA